MLRAVYEVLIGRAPPLYLTAVQNPLYILYIYIYIYILWVVCSVVRCMLSLMSYAQRRSSGGSAAPERTVRTYVHQFSPVGSLRIWQYTSNNGHSWNVLL